MSTNFSVEMRKISKHFGGVQALDDVSLSVRKGEVHALVGENGAGKSTLMKILSGAYPKDDGKIILEGVDRKITSPKQAIDAGVAVIYQEFMLAPDLTVAENIFIDQLVGSGLFINWKQLYRNTRELLMKFGFGHIDPLVKVGRLSVAYQQVVEICKCLTRESKVLVFDEPTAVLSFSETEQLFSIIRQLKSEGVSIIYISHRLDEIFELCDRITVLKDGRHVDTVEVSNTNKAKLSTMMVGRELSQIFPDRKAVIGEEILSVKNLHAGREVKGVSFSLKKGEVVGFSGLVGAGRTECMRAIFGAEKIESGEVLYLGRKVRFRNPKDAILNGFGLLPEDRKTEGLLLGQSIRLNTTLASLRKVTNRANLINHTREIFLVENLLNKIATKYDSTEDNVSSLSGGNQQKVVVAKWLAADCKCIVFDEPTRGVDVGAKTEIYRIMNQLAEEGVGILMISSEMAELIGMCDRVYVMRQGKITGDLDRHDLNEEKLIKYAMGM